MTLPFKSNKKRVYQCFVCGIEFKEYEEFKSHILENHIEGREYILCPICKSPVRDRRMHHGVYHKNQPLIQNGTMRATIWYDFSGKNSKRKPRKPNFKEGYMVSIKNNAQIVHYRSSLELSVLESLEELNEIARYEVEPKDCVTPYFDKKWRKYWPDFKVYFTDGHIEIWEVKPSSQTSTSENQAKFQACQQFCENYGYRFEVINELEINRLKMKVAQQKKQQ